jgi:CrcB protein
MKLILAIALGGALGSVARHVVSGQVARLLGGGFPCGILLVNILGSLAIGVLAEPFALRWSASLETRALLTVGILGGFTTFSGFSLDAALPIARGEFVPAALSVLASVALSIGVLFAGLYLVRLA